MSHQPIPLRPIRGQSSQLLLPQRTIRALQRLPSRRLDPKVKALQHMQLLQRGSKTVMTKSLIQELPHLSFDAPIAQSRNPLWVNSSRLYFHIQSNIYASQTTILSHYLTLTCFPCSRHVKTHTLPYRCDFQGCGIGKATQRDLDRHKDTHGKIRLYFCPVPGCPWHVNGDKIGFSRRLDNAKRHLKSHTNSQNLSVLREDSQGRLCRA
jgi:hypothetical protein